MTTAVFTKFAQKTAFAVTLGILGAVGFASNADAATCSVDAVMIDGIGSADACNGPIGGNDTGNSSSFLDDLSDGSIFAGYSNTTLLSEWILFGKSDDGNVSVTADEGFDDGFFKAFGVTDTLVITLKASNAFTAFLFTGVGGPDIMGSFNTQLAGLVNDNNGNGRDLSHLSIFTIELDDGGEGGGGGGNEVPLPAAGWMLIAGLGGLVAARRRRKS